MGFKAAVMAGVLENLPSEVAWGVRWSKSVYPSVDNPELYASLAVGGLERITIPGVRRIMFLDDAGATQLERSTGLWPAIEREDDGPIPLAQRKSACKGL